MLRHGGRGTGEALICGTSACQAAFRGLGALLKEVLAPSERGGESAASRTDTVIISIY